MTRRRYYRHGRVPAEFPDECPNRNRYLRADELERHVEGLVREIPGDGRLRTATEAALSQFVDELQDEDHRRRADELKAEVEKVQRTLQTLVTDRAEADTLEERNVCQTAIDRVNGRVEVLKRELGVHESALARTGKLQRGLDAVGARAERLLALYEDATPSERRGVYTELIHRIVVAKDIETVTIELSPLPAEEGLS